jgi:hypothetical protein
MDTMTQQNAALVEQMAASAMQLREQTASVAAAVQVFKLDGRTARARYTAPPRRPSMQMTADGAQQEAC